LPGSSAGRLQEAILELLRAALLYMGSATMDRLLRAEKATGDHCYTLTVTDRRPWWTAIVPVPSRAQVYVFAALTTVLSHLPFPVLVLHAEGNLFTDAPYYKTIRYDVSSLDQDTFPVDSLVARRPALLDRYLQIPELSQAFRDVDRGLRRQPALRVLRALCHVHGVAAACPGCPCPPGVRLRGHRVEQSIRVSIVRTKDTRTWVEVLDGDTWVRYDPTPSSFQ